MEFSGRTKKSYHPILRRLTEEMEKAGSPPFLFASTLGIEKDAADFAYVLTADPKQKEKVKQGHLSSRAPEIEAVAIDGLVLPLANSSRPMLTLCSCGASQLTCAVEGSFYCIPCLLKRQVSWAKRATRLLKGKRFQPPTLERVDTLTALALALRQIENEGFRPAQKSLEPTSEDVWQLLRSDVRPEPDFLRDAEEAQEILLERTPETEFDQRLMEALRRDSTNAFTIGLITYSAFWALKLRSEWVGEVGERIEVDVVLVGEEPFQEDGRKVLLRTKGGNILKWLTSWDTLEIPRTGHTRVRATVKAHTTFKGVKETKVNRVRSST